MKKKEDKKRILKANLKLFCSCKGVFQGGGMKGIAFIGAYEEIRKQGITFVEVSGTSAGAIMAAFIAAGATPGDMRIFLTEVKNDFERIKCKYGWRVDLLRYLLKYKCLRYIIIPYICAKYTKKYILHSSSLETVIDTSLKKVLKLDRTVTFQDLKMPLTVVASDLKNHTYKEFSTKNDSTMSVAHAVICSSAFPYIFPIQDGQYLDGCIVSNLPIFTMPVDSKFDRIIAFTLSTEKKENIEGVIDMSKQIFSTVSQGGVDVQLKQSPHCTRIPINTSGFEATDYGLLFDEKRQEDLINRGRNAMQNFLYEKHPILDSNLKNNEYQSSVEIRTQVSYVSNLKMEEVIVTCKDTKWCWEEFPLLLKWHNEGAKISVYCKKNDILKESEKAQRRMLIHMGIEFYEMDKIPVTGYFLKKKGAEDWECLTVLKDGKGKYFNKREDKFLITSAVKQIKEMVNTHYPALLPLDNPIKIVKETEDAIIERLKNIKFYKNASLEFQDVEVDNLKFITRYVLNYKYQNIDTLYKIYINNGLVPFEPASFLFYKDKHSLIGPPVVEECNGEFYIIEGNSRIYYAYKKGIKTLRTLVVRGVKERRVTEESFNIDEVVLSSKKITAGDRYDDFDYAYFRPIESTLRPYESYLIE